MTHADPQGFWAAAAATLVSEELEAARAGRTGFYRSRWGAETADPAEWVKIPPLSPDVRVSVTVGPVPSAVGDGAIYCVCRGNPAIALQRVVWRAVVRLAQSGYRRGRLVVAIDSDAVAGHLTLT